MCYFYLHTTFVHKVGQTYYKVYGENHCLMLFTDGAIIYLEPGTASISWCFSKTPGFCCQNLGFFENPDILMSLFRGYSKAPSFGHQKYRGFDLCRKLGILHHVHQKLPCGLCFTRRAVYRINLQF